MGDNLLCKMKIFSFAFLRNTSLAGTVNTLMAEKIVLKEKKPRLYLDLSIQCIGQLDCAYSATHLSKKLKLKSMYKTNVLSVDYAI